MIFLDTPSPIWYNTHMKNETEEFKEFCRWCGEEVFIPGGRDMCSDCGFEIEEAMAQRNSQYSSPRSYDSNTHPMDRAGETWVSAGE